MKNIKVFKISIMNLQGIITYELDVNSRKEKITKITGKNQYSNEQILNSANFAEKLYIIKKNTDLLKNQYINNSIIDGETMKIEIMYENNEIKNIICKNEFPSQISEIRNVLMI